MQTKTCPTCGHPLPDDTLPADVHLTTQEQRVFKIVSRYSTAGLSQSELANLVYAERPDGGPENANVTLRTTIYHINKKLQPLRLRIIGHQGYRLVNLP